MIKIGMNDEKREFEFCMTHQIQRYILYYLRTAILMSLYPDIIEVLKIYEIMEE